MRLKKIALACVWMGAVEASFACSVSVSDVEGLQSAINAAEPGAEICLKAGIYDAANSKNGTIMVKDKHGRVGKAISVRGLGGAQITSSGSNYGLHILNSSYLKIENIAVRDTKKAIMLDGASHVVLSKLDISHTAEEAVHFRTNSKHSILIDSKVSNTGVKTSNGHEAQARYGEAVYIGSAKSNWKNVMGAADKPDLTNNICMSGNTIGPNIGAEAVDVKEGSTQTYILSNTFDLAGISGFNFADSALDLKGSSAFVGHNKFINSAPTYLEKLYRISKGEDVPIATPGKVNGQITPDAIQTHIVPTNPDVGSGSKNLIWNNVADLASAKRPAGYAAGMLLRIDDGQGSPEPLASRLCAGNGVAQGDVLSNVEAVACADSPAIKTCPDVLSLPK